MCSSKRTANFHVLPNQVSGKEKSKDSSKSTKKRSEDRIKEAKGRISKNYAEERQKHLEKREEQRKKLGSAKVNRVQSDRKGSSSSAADVEENSQNETKASESKANNDDPKKDLQNDKKGVSYKSDDIKRKSKDYDRVNRTKERKDDKYKKKIGDKKHDGLTKVRHKKENSSKETVVKDSDKNVKNNDVENEENAQDVCGSPSSNDNGTNVDATSKKTEEKEADKDDDEEDSCEEEKFENSSDESSESVVNLSSLSENKLTNFKVESRNSSKESITKSPRRNSLESCNKDLLFLNWEKMEGSDLQEKKVRGNSLEWLCVESTSNLCCNDVVKRDSKVDCSPHNEGCLNNEKLKPTENLNKKEKTIGRYSQRSKLDKSKEKCVLKRRNSIEMCDRTLTKMDTEKDDVRTEPVRRNSLESGERHTKIKSSLAREHKRGEKKVDEGSESKARDPRTERRIRNKDRPTMELYRPGMGRLSKQRLEREKVLGSSTEVDSNSPSPSPTLVPKQKSNQASNHPKDPKESEK